MKKINRDILALAVPSILANLTVPLVGMVDIAVAGHLGTSAAALIGGIAIGTMLFDLLYWNFGFLRVGTSGLTAQAFGRNDSKACADLFSRALLLALAVSAVILALQKPFASLAFLVVECTPEVKQLALQYYFIRIWAAPATLSLMAFRGWFIGMQDSVSSMTTDLVINGVNIAASILLSLGIPGTGFNGIGFRGVAWGTVVAQYSGLVTAGLIVVLKYRKKVFRGYSLRQALSSVGSSDLGAFFSLNADIFVRSLCFIGIYIGFTIISARFGDTMLASASILMKLMMVFSYFTDGFAYAGEALCGKAIGARDKPLLTQATRHIFLWGASLALVFLFVYAVAGVPVLRLLTSDETVINASRDFLPWLSLMPFFGIAGFVWDGIYIGATASKAIRNAMLLAAISFFGVWFAGAPFVQTDAGGIHLLMAAYFAHLLARGILLTVRFKKDVVLRYFPA